MESLTTVILCSLLASALSGEFNRTQLDQLTGKIPGISNLKDKMREHVSEDNELSLALFFIHTEYVGSGVLVTWQYVLTVATVASALKVSTNNPIVNFGASAVHSAELYDVSRLVIIPNCDDLLLVMLRNKVDSLVPNSVIHRYNVLRTPVAEDDVTASEVVCLEWKEKYSLLHKYYFEPINSRRHIYSSIKLELRYGDNINDGAPIFYGKQLIGLAISDLISDRGPFKKYSRYYVKVGPFIPAINAQLQGDCLLTLNSASRSG